MTIRQMGLFGCIELPSAELRFNSQSLFLRLAWRTMVEAAQGVLSETPDCCARQNPAGTLDALFIGANSGPERPEH